MTKRLTYSKIDTVACTSAVSEDVAHCIASIMATTASVFERVRRLADVDPLTSMALGRLAASVEIATLSWCEKNVKITDANLFRGSVH